MSSRHNLVVIDDDGPLRDDAGADNATVGLRTAMKSTGSALTPSIWIQVMNLEEELSGSKATVASLRTQLSSLQVECARLQAENVRLRTQNRVGSLEDANEDDSLPSEVPVNDKRHSKHLPASHEDARPPKRHRTDIQAPSNVREELEDDFVNCDQFCREDGPGTKTTIWLSENGYLASEYEEEDDSWSELEGRYMALVVYLEPENPDWLSLDFKGKCLQAAVYPRKQNWTIRQPGKYACKDCTDTYVEDISSEPIAAGICVLRRYDLLMMIACEIGGAQAGRDQLDEILRYNVPLTYEEAMTIQVRKET
ncbi:hypothetical protein KCU67_g3052, partial [Aureobasidium melanogenum]